MTIAKDSANDEIIHGNDLRGMGVFYVKTTSFECPYEKCRIKATPCSYAPDKVRQSYFRYDDDHKKDCGIHDFKNSKDHSSNDKRKENSPPAPVISLLKLNVPERNKRDGHYSKHVKLPNEDKYTNEHPVSTSSIKPIVDYYINNTTHDEYISIPPYEKRTYAKTFQLIIYKNGIRYIKPAIYFGSIQSNTIVDRNSDKYVLTFLSRDKQINKPFRLEIDVSKWNDSQKDVFYKELEKQRVKAEEYRKSYKYKNKYLTVFFFGFPDENDRFLFKTDYFKLVYILFLGKFEMSYNDTNYIIENEKEPALVINNSFSSFDIRGIGNTDNVDDSFDLIDNILPEPEPVAKESNILLKGIGAVLKLPIIIMNIWRH
ncbi:TPA: hypothetical protein U5E44_004088 [Yersinia enterocolitica]|nr:hypothetical protein [Yersinia enterocolitica]